MWVQFVGFDHSAFVQPEAHMLLALADNLACPWNVWEQIMLMILIPQYMCFVVSHVNAPFVRRIVLICES
jgi:predicted Na+-dependent transporter